jgi:hypothetical protein
MCIDGPILGYNLMEIHPTFMSVNARGVKPIALTMVDSWGNAMVGISRQSRRNLEREIESGLDHGSPLKEDAGREDMTLV